MCLRSHDKKKTLITTFKVWNLEETYSTEFPASLLLANFWLLNNNEWSQRSDEQVTAEGYVINLTPICCRVFVKKQHHSE